MKKEVILAQNAGFCFGASRGYDAVKNAVMENKAIYTYGPILNNAKIVEEFAQKGVRVVNDINEFESLPPGKIIIRSHGVSKEIFEGINQTGFEVFDATCPFVKRIHKIVEKQSELGDKIIVIGNPDHPEVKGIVGWCKSEATVIQTVKEAEDFSFSPNEPICMVSQTTFNRNKFQDIVDIFGKKGYNVNVMNTICDATAIRQEEASDLSKKADVMIVIGDRESSNSRKLFEICAENCDNTFFIETVEDIKGKLPSDFGLIGITAGASTPKYIIEEVQNYVRVDF